MTFNGTAQSLTKHGYARPVDIREGMDLLQQAYEQNLVQFGENVRESVNFICNCCGCCCEAMIAARKFGILNPVHTSNFLPVVDEAACNGCGKCVNACPVEAMTLVSTNDPKHPKMKKAKVDDAACLGCGVCLRTCSHAGLSLRSPGGYPRGDGSAPTGVRTEPSWSRSPSRAGTAGGRRMGSTHQGFCTC